MCNILCTYKSTCPNPLRVIRTFYKSDYTNHSNGGPPYPGLICCCWRLSDLTSLNTLMSLINEAMSCSSPVMASIPGSMRFKKESRSFKVEDTWKERNKLKWFIKTNGLAKSHCINSILTLNSNLPSNNRQRMRWRTSTKKQINV